MRDDPAQEARRARDEAVLRLLARMDQARAAARFVFRDHPEIARQAMSRYKRRKRRTPARAAALTAAGARV